MTVELPWAAETVDEVQNIASRFATRWELEIGLYELSGESKVYALHARLGV